MTLSAKRNFRRSSLPAFSLVEVTIVLGVISVAAIPVLALLVTGFQTMKNSNADVRSAIIAQKIIASAQMLPFAQLASTNYSLDIEGKAVAAQEAVFQASLSVTKQPAGNIITSSNVARVSVEVTGPAMNNERRVYSEILVNLDTP